MGAYMELGTRVVAVPSVLAVAEELTPKTSQYGSEHRMVVGNAE
jgi:hypothetical protein